jgi:hypothetical protein
MRLPSLKVRLLVMLAVVPLLAWFLVKPVRVLAPQLAGVSCLSASVCVDDAARRQEAEGLRAEAMAFVQNSLGAIEGNPPHHLLRLTGLCRIVWPWRPLGGHAGNIRHGDRPARLEALLRSP